MSFEASFFFQESVVNIVKALSRGKKRFRDLEKVASTGTVYQRVRELEEIGVLQRTVFIPPRKKPITYYELTHRGKEVLKLYNEVQSSLSRLLR